MRIAFFTDSFSPIANGVTVSIHTFRRELEKQGHKVYIFAPKIESWKDSDKYIARVPVVYSPFTKNKPVFWKINFNREKIKKLGLDIVHSHFYYNYTNKPRQLADIAGVPLVHTVHNLFPEFCYFNHSPFQSPEGAKRACETTFRNYLNNTDLIIAPSVSTKKYIEKKMVKTDIEILSTGIYPGDFISYPPHLMRMNFSVHPKSKVLLYVGSISKEKNIEFLLKAFKKVWQALENVHLLIIGGGPSEQEIFELIARQPFSGSITTTGYLPKNKVNKIYGACDLTLIPSPLESQSLVTLESFASGTPVIAVKGSGATDFIDDRVDGVISKLDLNDFSDKIISLLRAPNKLVHLGRNARIKARRFNAKNQTGKLIEIYKSITGNFEREKHSWNC